MTVRTTARLEGRYQDKITGVEGICTGISHYLTGCARILLEYGVSGKPEGEWFDENRLIDLSTRIPVGTIIDERTGIPTEDQQSFDRHEHILKGGPQRDPSPRDPR